MFILGNQLSRKYLFLSLCSCGFDDLVEEEENQLGHLWIRRATRERSPVNDLIVSPTLAHPDRAAIVFKGRSRAGQVRCDHLSKSNLFVAPNGSSINEHVARLYGWVLWGLIFCTINREWREERRRGREKNERNRSLRMPRSRMITLRCLSFCVRLLLIDSLFKLLWCGPFITHHQAPSNGHFVAYAETNKKTNSLFIDRKWSWFV